MPRVVPSQVVSTIEVIASAEKIPGVGKVGIHVELLPALRAILALTRRIPAELLVLTTTDYTALMCAQAAIETIVVRALRRKIEDDQRKHLYLVPIPGFGDINPIFLIRDALAKCPGEYPSPSTSELKFIEADYRDVLRLDVSAVNQALSQGEWKAATVLAGSVVEALLLWAIKTKGSSDIQSAISRLLAAKKLKNNPGLKPDHWDLNDHIQVALELKLIGNPTAIQACLAKDFRNLIHPGRAIRKIQLCNRGTALSAVAAVEQVVADLTKLFPPQP